MFPFLTQGVGIQMQVNLISNNTVRRPNQTYRRHHEIDLYNIPFVAVVGHQVSYSCTTRDIQDVRNVTHSRELYC